jgi:hypothetical protein
VVSIQLAGLAVRCTRSGSEHQRASSPFFFACLAAGQSVRLLGDKTADIAIEQYGPHFLVVGILNLSQPCNGPGDTYERWGRERWTSAAKVSTICTVSIFLENSSDDHVSTPLCGLIRPG